MGQLLVGGHESVVGLCMVSIENGDIRFCIPLMK